MITAIKKEKNGRMVFRLNASTLVCHNKMIEPISQKINVIKSPDIK